MNGAISYADEPCVGAQRIDTTPVRGVTHLSGSRRVGQAAANDMRREQVATALRPLTGMDSNQFASATRRANLAPVVRQECSQLEAAILQLESAEKAAGATEVGPVQQQLFALRKRFKKLIC